MRMEFNKLRVMKVHLDNSDKCFDCRNKRKCPLICCLQDDVAVLRHENVRIYDCAMFKKR